MSPEPKLLVYHAHQKPSAEAMISADMVVEIDMTAQTATVVSNDPPDPFDERVLKLVTLPLGYDLKHEGDIWVAVLDQPDRQHVGPVREYAVEAVVDAWRASIESPRSLAVTSIMLDGRNVELDGWELVQNHIDDPVRCLTIAGALIAAELERVLRQAQE